MHQRRGQELFDFSVQSGHETKKFALVLGFYGENDSRLVLRSGTRVYFSDEIVEEFVINSIPVTITGRDIALTGMTVFPFSDDKLGALLTYLYQSTE